jgi:hypothetical protein
MIHDDPRVCAALAEAALADDRHETHEITKHTKTLKYFVSFVVS